MPESTRVPRTAQSFLSTILSHRMDNLSGAGRWFVNQRLFSGARRILNPLLFLAVASPRVCRRSRQIRKMVLHSEPELQFLQLCLVGRPFLEFRNLVVDDRLENLLLLQAVALAHQLRLRKMALKISSN
jgi:hypothetical protein